MKLQNLATTLACAFGLLSAASAATVSTVEFSEIGIPYGLAVTLNATDNAEAPPDHVGAWSWDEDSFPATAKGWTHTSKFVKLELTEAATFTLTLSSAEGVPWPAADNAARLAGTNLFPSFTLYRGWDTDAGPGGVDQDHTFNNRGNIAWAEDVTYLDHLDNATTHTATRTWILPAGQYTVNLGGNSPVTLAEGRQGYHANFTTTPAPGAIAGGFVSPVEFSEIGIPYGLKVQLGAIGSAEAPPDHVGAWSWDEDSFPATAKGWTHTSKFVQLELTEAATFTLTLSSAEGVPWPATDNAARLAGTNLFPSFTLYRGWDTDAGLLAGETPGTTLDQDHTFNNRGNIAWAEDVVYLDHLDNSTAHTATRTWILPAGQYTVNLGGNSPVTLAEGRQGYHATFTTSPAPGAIAGGFVSPVEFSEVGIPYGLKVQLGASSSATAPPDHVGAWSWDEDSFPATAKGWTHTSKFVQLDLTENAVFTLTLSSAEGVPWPATDNAARLAGTNLFPSFTLYRGWDTDAGPSGVDQDHTFNNRGNIVWAEDVTYLDHLDNSTAHSASQTWILPAGHYTLNLGGNSPVALAEGRQGYQAMFSTRAPILDSPTLDFSMADEGHFHAKWAATAAGVTLFHAQSLDGPWTPIEAELVPEGDEVEAHIHFHKDSLFLRLQ